MVFRKGGFLGRHEKWYFGGQLLEVVNSYKYLGFDFTTRMSMKSSVSSFIIKAKSALNSLFKSLNSVDCHETNIFFKLFDSKVSPILSYSSELWGVFNIDDIEKVHTLAIKRFLNVSSHCSNSIIYGETGRVPLSINHTISSLKYWLKLTKRPNTCLSKQAYEYLVQQSNKGGDNWANRIKTILCESGFGMVWLCGYVTDENYILSEIKTRLTDIFIQTWNSKMVNNRHTQFYYSFKSIITPEYYLSSQLLCSSFKVCLSRFRCGVSKLNAHRYKYYQNESLLLCPFCPNQIENEMHSIFFCKAYNEIRSKFIPKKFIQKPNLQTLIILIANESYQISLAKYLLAMFSQRNRLLKHITNNVN